MEKVQFQLEATLPELKDLHEKGLFSKYEINEITRRRTGYETSLIRQVTRKEDFFKYAEYEINLERLRRVRWKRLKYHLNPPPPSASTYSLPRRALYILKRATVKFSGDLAVWLAYVEYASRQGMRKVVSKGLNSALQQHPLSSTLYILISYHHLHPSSPFPRSAIPSSSKSDPLVSGEDEADTSFALEGTSPARTTLLLGLRLLPRSEDLWREYIKLELGWVEALRRRWEVLGIHRGVPAGNEAFQENDQELLGGEGSFGRDGEEARKAILSGQLVIRAISSALEAIPAEKGKDFREGLLRLLLTYPSPLRSKALDVVYHDLERVALTTGNSGPQALLLVLTKRLYDRPYDSARRDSGGVVLYGAELVEEVGRIGKGIRRIAKRSKGTQWSDVAGNWLATQIDVLAENAHLREYLLSIMTSLTKSSMHPSSTLLLLHLDHLARSPSSSSVLLNTARSHASIYPHDPTLQRVRIRAEMEHESDSDLVKSACRSITKSVTRPNLSSSDQEEVQSIWFIWADLEEKLALGNGHPIDRIWDEILRESLRLNEGLPDLHPSLLGKYFISSLQRDPAQSAISILNRISVKFRPSTAFFKIAFPALTTPSTNKFCELSKLYTAWRAVCKTGGDRVEAVMVWAEWLMGHGKGRDAGLAVDVVRREVLDDEDSSGELWRGWKGLLDMRERIMEEGDGDLVMGDVPDGENLVSLDLEEDGGGNGQEEDEEEAEEEAEEEDSLMDHEEESEGNSVHRGEAS